MNRKSRIETVRFLSSPKIPDEPQLQPFDGCRLEFAFGAAAYEVSCPVDPNNLPRSGSTPQPSGGRPTFDDETSAQLACLPAIFGGEQVFQKSGSVVFCRRIEAQP